MSRSRVLILCGRSPRHLFVANQLCDAAIPVAIVQETGREWTVNAVSRALRPANLWSKVARHLREVDTREEEAKFFFGGEPAALTRPELVTQVPYINHPKVEALAARLQPDIVAVFGTGLIREPLLSAGRLGIVNLHGGVSPRYRGSDCTFWALYNGEFDQVGCTLHFIDRGIDTGDLIAHICPAVTEGEDELTLFWRAVRDSGSVYAECLERLDRGELLGRKQGEKGTLYLFKHRTRRHEQELHARLRSGLLKGLRLPARVHWFERAADP
ncbi:MAG: formyl transferase [Alphaproteobacteria bacterium]|nr:formyl transferase [Alphaproteobacteria bacterium]